MITDQPKATTTAPVEDPVLQEQLAKIEALKVCMLFVCTEQLIKACLDVLVLAPAALLAKSWVGLHCLYPFRRNVSACRHECIRVLPSLLAWRTHMFSAWATTLIVSWGKRWHRMGMWQCRMTHTGVVL